MINKNRSVTAQTIILLLEVQISVISIRCNICIQRHHYLHKEKYIYWKLLSTDLFITGSMFNKKQNNVIILRSWRYNECKRTRTDIFIRVTMFSIIEMTIHNHKKCYWKSNPGCWSICEGECLLFSLLAERWGKWIWMVVYMGKPSMTVTILTKSRYSVLVSKSQFFPINSRESYSQV